ncbi:MAG: insulinase family protein [Muribaculaceae bacterium]|nr:insulinase family protein [Muribaculaceae bacterium]
MKRISFMIATMLTIMSAMAAKEKELPVDPEVRVGKLENGLTYYIRHNEQPKGRAEFWLVQGTGSLVEEDDERGMAHFIEHIAFQGSRNFPDIDMVDILQNNGVSFGRDINASTGFDDTRFQISNVPTDRTALLDTVLLMLRDLSCELTFDERAIEEERGVIQEEWRMQADQTLRLYENTLPILLSGSRYAYRIAIGDMSVVRHITRQQLLSFYHRWYTPDRQAVFIVGDFDAERMEQMVHQIMGKIPKRYSEDVDPNLGAVPDHAGVTYALHTDPEASNSMVYLMFEHQPFPVPQRNTDAYLKHNIISTLVQNMLTERLDEMTRTAASPIDHGAAYDQHFLVSRTRDALTLAALAKEGRTLEALDSLASHATRAMQHGFTPGELERARRNAIAVYSDLQAEAKNRTSREYTDEYIDHYINGGYIPGVIAESQLLIDGVQHITADEVNGYLKSVIGKDNVSVLISGPQTIKGASRYPTSRDVIAHFNRIISSPQSPYIDLTADDRLLAQEPRPGGIINETYEPETGITTMTLHNGATVRLKPTTFKNNEVLFNAFSLGGEWAYGDTADVNVRLMDQVVEECALGSHSINQLNRMMSGRQLGISFILNDANEQLSGACQSADLETLLQLCYLYFTDVSLDKDAFESVKTRVRSQLSQASYNPKIIYSDSIGSTIYCGNPMYRHLNIEEVDQLDGERLLQLYRQRVANAGDYSFSIVGAFTVDEVRPLIKKYLASLPDNGVREGMAGYRPVMATGMVDNFFEVPMRNPKSSIYVSIMGDNRYSYDDEFMMDLVGESMGTALLTFLRHEKHGTYDVVADGSHSIYDNRWMINYEFETSTADRDSMLIYADYAVNAIFYNGVSEDLFVKMKERVSRQHESALQTNSYWMNALRQRALGVDIIGGFDRIFPTLTQESLNNYIYALRPHTRLRIVMN